MAYRPVENERRKLCSGGSPRPRAVHGRATSGEWWLWRPFAVLTIVVVLAPAVSEARFGSWQCTSNQKVVSRGDFRSYRFAPVLSPRMRAFRWSTSLHYLNNLTCVYQLRAPFGHHIYYELPTFDLHSDCRGDRVVIVGGDRTHRAICGSGRRLLHPYGVVRSNVVSMRFTTDGSGTATGFSGFFAAFKPLPGGFGAQSAGFKPPGIKRARRDLDDDDDDEYYEPKINIGEINLQQMRVLTGEASLDSYCRSIKRFGWELATSSCTIQADAWGAQPRMQSLTHLYRAPHNDIYDSAVRSLSRRSLGAGRDEPHLETPADSRAADPTSIPISSAVPGTISPPLGGTMSRVYQYTRTKAVLASRLPATRS